LTTIARTIQPDDLALAAVLSLGSVSAKSHLPQLGCLLLESSDGDFAASAIGSQASPSGMVRRGPQRVIGRKSNR
jgi:hypothetical protein